VAQIQIIGLRKISLAKLLEKQLDKNMPLPSR
jgi:hypothetical protein